VDPEEIHLALVVTSHILRPQVVSIAAANRKPDGPLPQPSCLTLHPGKETAIVDNEVVTRVLPKRHQNLKADFSQGKHDGERGLVADILWMLHIHKTAERLGWAMSQSDNRYVA
jgi:hypothetical protein